MNGTERRPDGSAPVVGGLRRDRLLRALDALHETRLALVVAPPGAGKTTLLAHWAERSQEPVAWFGMEEDAEPGTFLERIGRSVASVTGASVPTGARASSVLTDRSGPAVCLVVDDLHRVLGTPAEAELEHVIRRSAPRVRLLLGSRCVPAFDLVSCESAAAVVLGWEDLRFRIPETYALFRDIHRLPLDPAAATTLTCRTDGWAAALHLFHLSAGTRTPVELRRAAAATTTRYAWRHVDRHMLAGISSAGREFLERTCHLDVLTPEHCAAVLDGPDAVAPLLDELVRNGLVVEDGDGRWRILAVLRDFLRHHSPDVHGHRSRAAEILEQQGDCGAAAALHAAAGAWDAAERLLARAGERALQPGLCTWASEVPPAVCARSPGLGAASARALLDDGALAAAGEVAAAGRARGSAFGEALGTIQAVVAQWLSPRPSEGESPLRTALRRKPGEVARSFGEHPRDEDLLTAGLARLLAGDERRALPLLRRCAEGLRDHPRDALAAQLVLALFEPREGPEEPCAASAEVDAVSRRAERCGYTWLARMAHGVGAALEGSTAGDELVAAVVEDSERRGDEWGAALLRGASAVLRHQGWGTPLQDGELLVLARRWRSLGACTLEAWSRSLHALHAAVLELPTAVKDTETAEAFARSAQVPGAQAVSYAAMARLRPGHAEELWRSAVDAADDAGFLRRPAGWSSHARPGGSGGGPHRDRSSGPVLAFTCFGGFSMHRDGAEVDLTDLRPMARTLLRMLALRAGRPVHREELMTALWGDVDVSRSLHSLQVGISSIRRVLGDAGQCDGRAVLARQDESYVLRLERGVSCDLVDFDLALKEAARARLQGDVPRAVAACRRAVDLYGGEVLPEEGPADWVLECRERYRLRAAEAACDLARLERSLECPGAAVAAASRSVEINPWSDASWHLLVDVLREAGDLSAAQRAQQRHRDLLLSLGLDDVGPRPGPGRAGPDRDLL